jgi:hypothetical protein
MMVVWKRIPLAPSIARSLGTGLLPSPHHYGVQLPPDAVAPQLFPHVRYFSWACHDPEKGIDVEFRKPWRPAMLRCPHLSTRGAACLARWRVFLSVTHSAQCSKSFMDFIDRHLRLDAGLLWASADSAPHNAPHPRPIDVNHAAQIGFLAGSQCRPTRTLIRLICSGLKAHSP